MRAPFESECAYFRDDDRTSTVRWFEAEPDAQPLPFPSVILDPMNEKEGSREWPVGIVDGARRKFKKGKAPAGLYTGHYCGTEADFQQGCIYDDAEPEVHYLANGFPSCCDPPLTALGGAGVGGIARLVVTNPVAPGSSCSNAAHVFLSNTYTYTLNPPASQWWHWSVPSAGTYKITITFDPPGVGGVQIYGGPGCSSLTLLYNLFGDQTNTPIVLTPPNVWVVFSFGGTAGPYTIRLDPP